MFLRTLRFVGALLVAVVCLLLEAALILAEFRYVQSNGWRGFVYDPVTVLLSVIFTLILVGAAIVLPADAWPWRSKKKE